MNRLLHDGMSGCTVLCIVVSMIAFPFSSKTKPLCRAHIPSAAERGIAIDDSVTYDTVFVDAWQYYDFIQYYDSSRVTIAFGELSICPISGQRFTPGLLDHDRQSHRPFFDSSATHLAAHSGSPWFSVKTGDTISFFMKYQEASIRSPLDTMVNIMDTIALYVDLVGASAGYTIPVDSIGVRPHTSVFHMYSNFISCDETGVLHKFIVPVEFADSVGWLRCRIAFHGDMNRYSVSRWDYISEVKFSDLTIYIRNELSIFLDTVQVPKRGVMGHRSQDGNIDISILDNGQLIISLDPTLRSLRSILIYDLSGKLMANASVEDDAPYRPIAVNVRKWSVGAYFITALDASNNIAAVWKFNFRGAK